MPRRLNLAFGRLQGFIKHRGGGVNNNVSKNNGMAKLRFELLMRWYFIWNFKALL
jgi:hypothetical protein